MSTVTPAVEPDCDRSSSCPAAPTADQVVRGAQAHDLGAAPVQFVEAHGLRVQVLDSTSSTVIYMTSPLFERSSFQSKLGATARGKRWLKLDVAGLLHSGGGQVGPIATNQLAALVPGYQSPLTVSDVLSTRPVAPTGTDQVDEAQTRRYQTRGDLTRTTALGSVIAKFAQLAGPRWKAQVWIDGRSLIRKARFTSLPIPSLGNSRLVITCTVSRAGAAGVVTIPPSSQVIDAKTLR